MAGGSFIIVWQRAVEWILPRREFYRYKIFPTSRRGIVKPAVIASPLFIPGAGAIWDWIVGARLLTDPEYGGHNILFPRILLGSGPRRIGQMRWRERQRIEAYHHIFRHSIRLLTELHLSRSWFDRT